MFVTSFTVLIVCRTPRGVRGLKLEGSCITSVETVRRTPRGVRGLKHNERVGTEGERMSHPSRGAWIETGEDIHGCPSANCRTPRGVRGLK